MMSAEVFYTHCIYGYMHRHTLSLTDYLCVLKIACTTYKAMKFDIPLLLPLFISN